jgi:hypothetical protein
MCYVALWHARHNTSRNSRAQKKQLFQWGRQAAHLDNARDLIDVVLARKHGGVVLPAASRHQLFDKNGIGEIPVDTARLKCQIILSYQQLSEHAAHPPHVDGSVVELRPICTQHNRSDPLLPRRSLAAPCTGGGTSRCMQCVDHLHNSSGARYQRVAASWE